MGWYGVQRAIIARDVDELAQELSPRRNPNARRQQRLPACARRCAVAGGGKVKRTLVWLAR